MWPYDVIKYTTQPPPECDTNAYANRCNIYARVEKSQYQLESCLSTGIPIVFGFQVWSSFMDPDGVVKT
eukprot:31271-Eustigmatos_ZCMA.PRE.1